MKRNTNLVTLGGKPVTLVGKLVKTGMQAKNFVAVRSDMQTVKLSDLPGSIKVISSVPSIETDVCSAQTKRFNLEASKLEGVQIITISCDLPFALNRYCSAESIDKVIMVSDHRDVDFGIKYGFLVEDFRLLARGVIIIDQYDTVRYVELVKEVGDHPNYEKALQVVKGLL